MGHSQASSVSLCQQHWPNAPVRILLGLSHWKSTSGMPCSHSLIPSLPLPSSLSRNPAADLPLEFLRMKLAGISGFFSLLCWIPCLSLSAVLLPGVLYPGITDPTFLSPGHCALRAGRGLLQGRGIQQASPWDQREGLEQGSTLDPPRTSALLVWAVPSKSQLWVQHFSPGRGAGAAEFLGFRA